MSNSTLHRTDQPKHYVSMYDLSAVEDPHLTGLAKALHLYAFSRPVGWDLRMGDLCNRFKERRDAIQKAMQNLEEQGYLVRTQATRSGGRFDEVHYAWHAIPIPGEDRKPLSRKRIIR